MLDIQQKALWTNFYCGVKAGVSKLLRQGVSRDDLTIVMPCMKKEYEEI